MSADRLRFRVWDKERGCWYNKAPLAPDAMFIHESGKLYTDYGDCDVYEATDDKYIVMQCTGLKDRTGQLVYEGDILEWKYPAGYSRAVVRFGPFDNDLDYEDRQAGVGFYIEEFEFDSVGPEPRPLRHFNPAYYPLNAWPWSVIGSIHANPELLK